MVIKAKIIKQDVSKITAGTNAVAPANLLLWSPCLIYHSQPPESAPRLATLFYVAASGAKGRRSWALVVSGWVQRMGPLEPGHRGTCSVAGPVRGALHVITNISRSSVMSREAITRLVLSFQEFVHHVHGVHEVHGVHLESPEGIRNRRGPSADRPMA